MTTSVDRSRLTPDWKMAGDDGEETDLLREMLDRAENYVASFDWCSKIVERFYGCGVGGVVAAFLFRFDKRIGGTDEWLWVVVGDLPSAYFVADQAPDGRSALSLYCSLMDEWAHAVLEGTSLDEVIPFSAPATQENARHLLSRTSFIRREIVPRWAQEA